MKKSRIFIASLVALTLSLSVVPVYAVEFATVTVNGVNIVVNNIKTAVTGESYTLDNGAQVPYSILYKDTTYLPMRKIGELVGKEVTYDKPSKTAFINATDTTKSAITATSATPKKGNSQNIGFSSNSLNISVDGKIVAKVGESYTLFNGTKVPNSLLHKGTTYLPMRKIADLVGMNIGYISSSKTAELRDKVSGYTEFPSVPDFGLISQTPVIEEETKDGAVIFTYLRKDLSDAENEMFITSLEDNGYVFKEQKSFPEISSNASGYVYENKSEKTAVMYGATLVADETYMFISIAKSM